MPELRPYVTSFCSHCGRCHASSVSNTSQVHVLRFPSLQELTQTIQKRRPNLLYLSSGIVITGHGSAVNDITLKPLEFKAEDGTASAAAHASLSRKIAHHIC